MAMHRSNDRIRSAVNATVETLERRQMLTTLVGGDSFEYEDSAGTTIRIVLGGNIEAAFVGLEVHPGVDDPPIEAGTLEFYDLTDRPDGADLPPEDVFGDLYRIYITAADADAYIAIAQVTSTGTARPMQPFTGSRNFEIITNFGPDDQFTAPTNTGAVLIGAQAVADSSLPEDTFILAGDYFDGSILGVPDDGNGQLRAGIEWAPGVTVGRILIGGIVTGEVKGGGSIDTFVAGALLTGNANGIDRNANPSDPDGDPDTNDSINDNFFVDGDIRNIFVNSSIGTNTLTQDRTLFDSEYNTGFDLHATGRVGHVLSLDAFYGSVRAEGSRPANELSTIIHEVEEDFGTLRGSDTYFERGFIGAATPGIDNNTFAVPQYLHTYFDSDLNEGDIAVVEGEINGSPTVDDYNDYYGLPLLAGQSVTVDLVDNGNLQAGVFDPDNRLIATDASHGAGINLGSTLVNEAFRFTADRPGVYRIVVGQRGDQLFDGPATQREVVFPLGGGDYAMTIRGAADINLGAVEARGTLLTDQVDHDSIAVIDGDLGAIVAGGNIVWNGANRFFVSAGNLRAIVADSIGYIDQGLSTIGGPSLHVRKGAVGLIQTTGTEVDQDMLQINVFDAIASTGFVNRVQAVGVDIQAVISATDIDGTFMAKRAIGVIRAPNIGNVAGRGTGAPFFIANSDGIASDGIIGLIDVPGDLGQISNGGPAIDTGSGGNVKYMNVGGAAFKDSFFGSGTVDIQSVPNQAVSFTDDSGTDVTLTPIAAVAGGGGFGQPATSGFTTSGFLTYLAYPTRSASGARSGSVLMRVTSTTGLRVESEPRSGNAVIDIAQIFVNGNGRVVNRSATTGVFTLVGGTQQLMVQLSGDAPINVLRISHDDSVATTGRFSDIKNTTTGDIVSIDARSIGRLEANNIGLPSMLNGIALLPSIDRVSPVQPTNEPSYPFTDQRTSVNVSGAARGTQRETGTSAGNVISIKARQSLGNIVIDGDADLIQANSDKRGTSGVFEGITAPILMYGVGRTVNPTITTGIRNQLNLVDIGEGLLPSGSGEFALSGIYVDGEIGKVGNQGAGSDIRGDIVSKEAIREITLKDGAIINNEIAVIDDFEDTTETPNTRLLGDTFFDTLDAPIFEIGKITLQGSGGIIGSSITAADIGPITVSGGFGLIASTLSSVGSNQIANVTVDGYGIRNTAFDGGARILNVTANGNGTRLSTKSYTGSVRLSGNSAIDPFFNRPPSKSTDLHVFLGTTEGSPKRKGVSNSGIIADSLIVASRDIASVVAWQIQSRNPFNALGAPIPFTSPQFPMRINSGNSLSKIETSSDIIGLAMSGGTVTEISSGGAIERSSFGISGRLSEFNVAGTFKGTSVLTVGGPEGALVSLTTGGSLFGQVNVALGVGSATIGGDFGSPSFLVTRNIDNLTIAGDVLTGGRIRTKRTLVNLEVGGDVQAGSTIQAKVISNQTIGGQVFGSIIITG